VSPLLQKPGKESIQNEMASVTPQRLAEFFTRTNDSYQVIKPIRDMCVFAEHNFLKDPHFGKMDFISCRNVLIYMEPYLQKKALTTFHYSLNQKGYLWLGKTETTTGVLDLFTSVSKTDKLFSQGCGEDQCRYQVPGQTQSFSILATLLKAKQHPQNFKKLLMRSF
jgi:two-component system CheB/CheR fusion protein